MLRPSSFPSRDQLSVLTAMILLAYALARLLDLPARTLGTTLFGSALGLEVGGPFLMLALVAVLVGAGADALIRSHPSFAGGPARTTLMHWILPSAAGLVLGAALNRMPTTLAWWLGLGLSAIALLLVLIAEYLTVDPDDPLRDVAALVLTGLAYLLALVLFVLLRSLGVRAAIAAPVGGFVAAGLAWRLFALRGASPARALQYAGIAGLICAEALWALNYWRLPASTSGLIVMIPFYISVGVAQQQLAGALSRRVWMEYLVVGLLGLTIAFASALFAGR